MIQVSTWILDISGLTNQSVDEVINNQDLSENEFALQSYMHAMSAQLRGDSQKAIVFLESALEQDPEFKQAWYELAIAYRKQGNYKKSLAILDSIKQTSTNLAYKVQMVKGHTLDSMKKFPQALEAYQQSYDIAKTLGSNDKISAIQVSRAITYINLEDFIKARDLLDAALQLTNPESQAQFYGVIMNNYAKLEKVQRNFEEARVYTSKAIDAFIKSGNKSSEMAAKTRLSSLLLHLGMLAEAEELAKESLNYAKLQNQIKSISSNHFKLGLIYHAIGKFKDSKDHWLSALEINKNLDLALEKAAIFEYLINLHIDFHDIENTQLYLKSLADLAKQQPLKSIKNILMRANFKYALARKDISQAQQILAAYQGKVTKNMSMLYGDLALLQKKYLAAENHYITALQGFSQTSDNLKITQVMNRLNKLYLIDSIDIVKAEKNISSMQQYNPFAYPYLKYKAILSFKQGKKIKAISLLQELKLKANDYWQAEDQLLLEQYQKH
ncbi:MAG TPA: tetratricopeptide repeat protein [Oceanospirillales bacterium]|nr:tetratricopeptide repeat protein [Oceanospirillales bacterium]